MESKGKAAAKPTPKQKVLALPGSRWLATRFAPAVPSFLAHISAPKKREDVFRTGFDSPVTVVRIGTPEYTL